MEIHATLVSVKLYKKRLEKVSLEPTVTQFADIFRVSKIGECKYAK